MIRLSRYFGLALVLSIAAAISARAQVFNSGIPSGFTCTGSCGVSGSDGIVPLAPLGGTQFGWISSVGGITIDPLGIPGTTNGSTLASSVFTATAGQVLSFRFNYITSDGGTYNDYAYVRLLGLGGPQILFTARTEPGGNTVPGQGLPGLAPGVTLMPSATVVVAGPPVFGPLGASSDTCWDLGCGYTGWIRAAYTLAVAGDFRIDFGVVNFDDELYDSALAFDFMLGQGDTPETPEDNGGDEGNTAPEPATLTLLLSGLVLVGARKRLRRQ